MRAAGQVLRRAVDDWFHHRSARLGAALAYYSVFSMGPLLLIVTGIAGLFFGAEAVRGQLTGQFGVLLGDAGSQALQGMLAGASSEHAGYFAAIAGALLLVVAALGVVVQLKDALNTIWDVEDAGQTGVWSYLRTYLVSMAGILGLGFLLAISLVVSTGIAAVSSRSGAMPTLITESVNFAASLALLALLFGMLFKWFPDTNVAWGDVVPGAVATAVLFNLGKLAIGWYVGTQGLESTYGAAASIVTLLVWVYYSAQIVLFGAELTHAYAAEVGSLRHPPEEWAPGSAPAGVEQTARRAVAAAPISRTVQDVPTP